MLISLVIGRWNRPGCYSDVFRLKKGFIGSVTMRNSDAGDRFTLMFQQYKWVEFFVFRCRILPCLGSGALKLPMDSLHSALSFCNMLLSWYLISKAKQPSLVLDLPIRLRLYIFWNT